MGYCIRRYLPIAGANPASDTKFIGNIDIMVKYVLLISFFPGIDVLMYPDVYNDYKSCMAKNEELTATYKAAMPLYALTIKGGCYKVSQE